MGVHSGVAGEVQVHGYSGDNATEEEGDMHLQQTEASRGRDD